MKNFYEIIVETQGEFQAADLLPFAKIIREKLNLDKVTIAGSSWNEMVVVKKIPVPDSRANEVAESVRNGLRQKK